jgi:FkbM family methyltransferase
VTKKNELVGLQEKYFRNEISKSDYINLMYQRHLLLFEYSQLLNSDADINKIEIDASGIVLRTRQGLKFKVDTKDHRSCPIEALNFKVFEQSERAIMLRIASKAQIIFDVGANVGWYSLMFSTLPNLKKISAFEALPQTYKLLTHNVNLNEVKNIELNNLAIYDSAREIELYWSETESGSTSIANIKEDYNAQKQRVNAITLDQYSERTGIWPDFIKIDIEGGELFALRGAGRILEEAKPTIFCELLRKWARKCGYDVNDILKLMAEKGYKCYCAKDGRLDRIDRITENTANTNFYFVHEQKRNIFSRDNLLP